MGEQLVVLSYGRKRLYTGRAETSQGASRGDHVRGAMRSPLTAMMAKAELKGKGSGERKEHIDWLRRLGNGLVPRASGSPKIDQTETYL
jgi:hypothetical protein